MIFAIAERLVAFLSEQARKGNLKDTNLKGESAQARYEKSMKLAYP